MIMDYMDVKALSEIVDGYNGLLDCIKHANDLALDEERLRSLRRRGEQGRKLAETRYNAAYDDYLKQVQACGKRQAA